MFIFFLYSWLTLDFSLCPLICFFFPLEAKSSLMVKNENSKLETAIDFIVFELSKPSFAFSSVFFLVQPGKKDIFFLRFVFYLVPVHSGSILPSVMSMSPLFLFFCFVPFPFDTLRLQRLRAVLLKATQQWFLPILLSKRDRKVSERGRDWGNREQCYRVFL